MEQDCLMEQVFSCFLSSVLHRVLISARGLEHVLLFLILPLDFILFDSREAREPATEIRKAINKVSLASVF